MTLVPDCSSCLKITIQTLDSRCLMASVKLLQSIYHHRSPPKATQAPESAVINCNCAIAEGQAGRVEPLGPAHVAETLAKGVIRPLQVKWTER